MHRELVRTPVMASKRLYVQRSPFLGVYCDFPGKSYPRSTNMGARRASSILTNLYEALCLHVSIKSAYLRVYQQLNNAFVAKHGADLHKEMTVQPESINI